MTDRITLTGIRARGFHGVFDEERRDGQDFVVDVTLELSLAPAAARDDVSLTVHYGEFAADVAGIIEGDPVNLIETLAERIATHALRFAIVDAVEVTVHKPNAPIAVAFGDVGVSVRRTRSGQ